MARAFIADQFKLVGIYIRNNLMAFVTEEFVRVL